MQGKLLSLTTAQIAPNPWNPNKQNEQVYQATMDALKKHGQVAPLVVRSTNHKMPDGRLRVYELIDGEHRLRALNELGIGKCHVYNLGEVPDSIAKKLTIMLGTTRGDMDPLKLGELYSALLDELDMEDLLEGVPTDEEEISRLIELADLDWDTTPLPEDFDPPAPQRVAAGEDAPAIPETQTTTPSQSTHTESEPGTPDVLSFGPFYLRPHEATEVQEVLAELTATGLSSSGAFLKVFQTYYDQYHGEDE